MRCDALFVYAIAGNPSVSGRCAVSAVRSAMFGGIFFAISVITVVAVFALYRNAMAAVAFDFGCIGMHFGFRFARIVAIAAMDQ